MMIFFFFCVSEHATGFAMLRALVATCFFIYVSFLALKNYSLLKNRGDFSPGVGRAFASNLRGRLFAIGSTYADWIWTETRRTKQSDVWQGYILKRRTLQPSHRSETVMLGWDQTTEWKDSQYKKKNAEKSVINILNNDSWRRYMYKYSSSRCSYVRWRLNNASVIPATAAVLLLRLFSCHHNLSWRSWFF